MDWSYFQIFCDISGMVKLVVKDPPANAGDVRTMDTVPGQEDPLEKEMATPSSILA